MELFKQVIGGFDDKTKDSFFQQARQMGFSEELISNVQSGIYTI